MRSTQKGFSFEMNRRLLFAVCVVAFVGGCGGGGQQAPLAAISVRVSPSSTSVQTGATQQFTATVSPSSSSQAVMWAVSGTGCTGAACGSIDATGKYTAPLSVPSPSTVSVTATSVADPTANNSASVTITPGIVGVNNAELDGQYAFLFNGFDANGAVAIAGSFTADGNGNLAGGIEDVSRVSGVTTGLAFVGTYKVGADNRGIMTLTSTQGSSAFSFALSSLTSGVAARGRLIESDSSATLGVGTIAKQDAASFSTAAVNGGYVFGFSGTDTAGNRHILEGRFTASGGVLNQGQLDDNDAGTCAFNVTTTGTYTVAGNGRGTITLMPSSLSTMNMSFYVVSATELFAMQVDTRSVAAKGVVSGSILQQSGGPFALSSLNGASVIAVSRGNSSVLVGILTFDGAGSLNWTYDSNNAGVITANGSFPSTYTIDANGLGRGVISRTGPPETFPIYLVSAGKGFIIDDEAETSGGSFDPQSAGPFNNSSIAGSYALGTLPTLRNSLMISGAIAITAPGTLAGTEDLPSSVSKNVTGTYSVSTNGRGTLTITPTGGTPSNEVFYLISPRKAVSTEIDVTATNPSVGVIEK
jgi:Bacterial Ig-like domain (group 2)